MIIRRFIGTCIRLNDYVRGRVFAGLLFMAPFVITLTVLAWIYGTLSGALETVFVRDTARYLPLATIGILLLAPFTMGLLLLFRPVRRVFNLVETGAQGCHLQVRFFVLGSTFRRHLIRIPRTASTGLSRFSTRATASGRSVSSPG